MKKIAFVLIVIIIGILLLSCPQANNDNESLSTTNILYVTATLSGTEVTISEATDGSKNQIKTALEETIIYADRPTITKITIVAPQNGAKIIPEPDLSSLFSDYTSLSTIEGLENIDTSNVTNMYCLFYKCSSLKNVDSLVSWDTSRVTNMGYMFYYCNGLKNIDLCNWNTSGVSNTSVMFDYCNNLISIDLSNWDTSNVTNMFAMFNNCTNLTTLDISGDGWNDSLVTNAGDMFKGCNALTQAGVNVGANITGLVRAEIDNL